MATLDKTSHKVETFIDTIHYIHQHEYMQVSYLLIIPKILPSFSRYILYTKVNIFTLTNLNKDNLHTCKYIMY